MKKWLKTLAISCAVIPFAQCALAPGHNVARAAESSAAVTDVDPALWVVKDEDTTIYLFGTVHVLKPGLGWFDDAVKRAFDRSDQLMLEIVLPEDPAEMAQKMIPLALDQSGKTISSRLSPAELKAYQAAMTGLGIPVAQFDRFEPWFAAMTLSIAPLAQLGYDPEQGAEKQLTAAAKAAAKPVSGLETVDQQLGFFDGLPEKQQLAFLNSVVKDIDKLGPTLDKTVVLWGKGDTEALAVAMNESMAATPELAKVLLFDRNQRWADQLKARMDQPGTVFVAVGAGHLAGEHSVQDFLKERGLTAERIEY
ncbi:TraB/GumN family protein [Sphingopyxis macrogoltabida]|uniref:Polysaccharide biosynthesis protein GumN n=1 Tax=Sphingopyxis macrogoltabida TaxID=33050 RepID=A0AAC8Z1L6_SPHMC|nr:TraB/GumN family protein [Sphingopyxis macrogoltabida]ALJ12370.1 polysaccharide biosynthesis protein GumN [Sphingopyxis macrogoltabida]AMU90149.1 polysaccharide biosynthesis protein GumN [Sphingopyxis macrogoltabida]